MMLFSLFLSFVFSARVEVYFSAVDGCVDKIIRAIDGAERSVKIAVFSFTSREIADALSRAWKRGVDVRIIVDGEQANDKFSKYGYIKERGLSIRIADYSSRRVRFITPKMHHKFMIVDSKYVMTGSYNFTASAERYNDENCIFIYEDDGIVKKFEEEFMRIWEFAR